MSPHPALHWRKSTFSGGGNDCDEVADLPDGTRLVRHSHHPDGLVLEYTATEWAAFTAGIRAGEFD